ncbi:monofunctional biosynthetic peptidoglycan transglycosylase [Hyphomicrobium sp. CS1GBMeth3]|uniref:monofunctional biosynthetic peptidoglycan transglycosylase n=1 Tax=Hyphomicrobium sp. CS1GBMeth3 TaxID=1892845 RepID=UPI001FCDFDE2|nr:monofunctional biosynthetic peptidoglycan transglycosylase [Hyphomicrobium sp. CS1GBMeth3]
MDKDTREAEGSPSEAASFADAPRSEGGPATRDPSPQGTEERAASPEAHAVSTPPDAPEDPLADAPESAALDQRVNAVDDPEPVQVSVPSPETDIFSVSPAEQGAPPAAPVAEPEPEVFQGTETAPPDVSDSEPWRGAIAEALAEPPPVLPVEPAPAEESVSPSLDLPAAEPELESSGDPPASSEQAPDPPQPAPRLSVASPAAAVDASEVSSDVSGPDTRDAAFELAAKDLFHPPESREDPHLITLGRRLDPALRASRSDVADIAPRSEAATGRATPWAGYLRTAIRYGLYAVASYFALVLVLMVLFRFVNPPGSMLMLTQLLGGTAIDRRWVPLSAISPHLVRAVIVSEDGRFCEHSGIDTAAIKEAIDRAARGTPRGASTISMQVTKNLFLWNAKSYLRKVIEIPLTLLMELVWPKWRVLEVYLNIAEWAPGVFGAEAAARHHFNKSAARLSERESALLAAVLPNPVVRNAGSPGPQTSAKARVVQARVRAYGAVASCVTSAAAPAPRPASAVPTVVKRPTARKVPAQKRPAAPARKLQQQQPKSDDWAPMINFGPP